MGNGRDVMLRSVRNHASRRDAGRVEALRRAMFGAASEGAGIAEIAEASAFTPAQVEHILTEERRIRHGTASKTPDAQAP